MEHKTVALKELRRIPNVGPAMAEDLWQLGIRTVDDLKGRDPRQLFDQLEATTQSRQDPCVLDTLMSAVHFAETGERRTWWSFTPERKRTFRREPETSAGE